MALFELLETLHWMFGALIAATSFALLATLGLFIVRRTVPINRLKSHHDVAGFVFTNLGVLYSVLLGFTVVNVQQRFDKIQDTVQIEASCLADLYRDAEVFPDTQKNEIHQAIKNYMESVIHDEWPLMSSQIPHPETIHTLRKIWSIYYEMDPTTPKELAWYSKSIDKLNDLLSFRLARLLGSEESLNSQMWALLVFGGLILTTFICFFGVDHFGSQILMASTIASSIAFLLFLIYSMDTAFSGNITIPPEAFLNVFNSLPN